MTLAAFVAIPCRIDDDVESCLPESRGDYSFRLPAKQFPIDRPERGPSVCTRACARERERERERERGAQERGVTLLRKHENVRRCVHANKRGERRRGAGRAGCSSCIFTDMIPRCGFETRGEKEEIERDVVGFYAKCDHPTERTDSAGSAFERRLAASFPLAEMMHPECRSIGTLRSARSDKTLRKNIRAYAF